RRSRRRSRAHAAWCGSRTPGSAATSGSAGSRPMPGTWSSSRRSRGSRRRSRREARSSRRLRGMSVRIDFTKGHGTENDFVVVDDPDGLLDLDATAVTALADRRTGIGGDGGIRAVRSHRARTDGLGAAPGRLLGHRHADGHVAESRFEILTRAGVRTVEILARPADPAGPWSVRVGMGTARCTPQARTVEIAGHRLTATDVDMGNPHAVAFLPAGTALEELDLTRRPGLEPEPARGANIELVSERGPRHVAMRVHERGVGETRSCGT